MPGRSALKNIIIAFHYIGYSISGIKSTLSSVPYPKIYNVKRVLTSVPASSLRGATPMPASLHGLLRVFQVLHRPGRARTLADKPGCASLRQAPTASQALSNAALRARVHCPAASAPLAPHSVRGAYGQKNPPRTAEQQRQCIPGPLLDRCLCDYGKGSVCFSAEGGGFFGCAPQHA